MDSRSAALGFAAGAALGAGALYLYSHSQRCQQTAAPPDSAAAAQQLASGGGGALPGAAAAAAAAHQGPVDMSSFEQDDILEEQLTRNVQFFGLEAQKRIGGSFVVVVGLGVRCRGVVRWVAGWARCSDGAGSASKGTRQACVQRMNGEQHACVPPSNLSLPRRAWGRTPRTCCCARVWAACA